MAKYIDWTKVEAVTGLTSATLTSDIKAIIEQQVEILGIDLAFGQEFSASHTVGTSDPEIKSIRDSNQSVIVLNNMPIISVARLRDNIQDANPTVLVEGTDFLVEKRTGVIKLMSWYDPSTKEWYQNHFTFGTNTVDVAYVYGRTSVPADIIAYANMIATMSVKQWKTLFANASAGTPDFEQMGDYQRRNASNTIGQIAGIAKEISDPILLKLKEKYLNMVEEG